MVAAMASSIYIIGILVSEDKNFVCFIGKCFVKNIHSIICSSTTRSDDQLIKPG
jgi:hypothetical protein